MPPSDPTLIVPVELQVREFDAKLLLSCVAAEAGITAVFGSQTNIHKNIERLPRGVYLTKDIRKSKLRIFRIMHDLGYAIIGWDEEGLVRYPSNQYFKMRVEPRSLEYIALWFAWGDEDAALMKTHPAYKGTPIHITGNPRTDMLRPEIRGYFDDDVAAIRRRFDRFILINTNFGRSNHFLPKHSIKSTVLQEELGDKATSWDLDLAVHRETLFGHFQQMVPSLAQAFPETTIVVRPHPAESQEVWRQAAQGCSNVAVVYEGNVQPWILASGVLVHNGCTTAVEAFLLDKPAITYKPVVSDRFDPDLPDSLSLRAGTIDDLIGQLGPYVEGSAAPGRIEAASGVLRRYLAPQVGGLASDRIIDIIKPRLDQLYNGSNSKFAGGMAHLRAKVRAAQKAWASGVSGGKNWHVYERHRFPGASVGHVEARIARLAALTGRFKHVKVDRLGDGVFEIRA